MPVNSKVSIVIPVYNAEKYLDRCIRSVTSQTHPSLELILVDDGSTDRSSEICGEWANRMEWIRVIHQNNLGAGYARNTGLKHATGEYVLFVDSDDYIAPATVEKALQLAQQEQAEVVTFGFCDINRNGRIRQQMIPRMEQTTFSGAEVQELLLTSLLGPDTHSGYKTSLHPSVWLSLYSMELLRRTGLEFVSERDVISEDIYFLLCLYKDVRRVSILSEALYYHCENPESLTHTYRKDRYPQIKYFYDVSMETCNRLNYSDAVKTGLAYPYLSNTIAAMKMIVTARESFQSRMAALREIIRDEHLQGVLRKTSIRRERRLRKLFLECVRRKSCCACFFLLWMSTRR